MTSDSASEHERTAIGIDLGGTKIEIAVVDSLGKVKKRVRRQTRMQEGYQAVKERIVSAVRQVLDETDSEPGCIGIGMAGQVEPESGTVLFAPNLGWENVPFRNDLKSSLSLPIAITNDVRTACWGEWMYGAGRGCNDLVAVFVGTGIGGGIISGGRVLSGCSNTFGEIGHMTVDLHGPTCHCGNRGCLEALAGGWAIAEQARDAVDSRPLEGEVLLRFSGGDRNAITAETVVQASMQGDPLAREIMDRVVEALTAASVGIVNGFNPCRLIFGGGVIEGYPRIIEFIEQGVRRSALGAATRQLQVMKAELGNDAAVIGAAAFALHTFSNGARHQQNGRLRKKPEK